MACEAADLHADFDGGRRGVVEDLVDVEDLQELHCIVRSQAPDVLSKAVVALRLKKKSAQANEPRWRRKSLTDEDSDRRPVR